MKIKLNPTKLKIKLNAKKIQLKKEVKKPYPIYKGTKKAIAKK